jgi:hypothetical protein
MRTKQIFALTGLTIFFSIYTLVSFAQADMHSHVPAGNAANMKLNTSFLFSLMELPFLFITVIFAFLTASALNGGKFGKGMYLVAWGFLVMAVGHLHMQVEHFYGFNLFKSVLGDTAGSVAWFIALVMTWGLSSLGFYSIYKASKS